jgi:3-mercaptopyruvate sulfurtransferase SseA
MQNRGRSPVLPILLAAAVLLIAGGVYLAAGQNRAAAPSIPPTQAVTELPDEHGSEGLPYPEVPRVNAAEAKGRVDAGQAILVDVRSQGEYDTAHAQGATLLSLADLEARYRELPQGKELIFYCT